MGASASISFGVMFDESYVFPWNAEPFDDDIECWWRTIKSYKPPFEPYLNGTYAPGFSTNDPRIAEYYEHRRQWLKDNPIPVELVNYCHPDCPMYILAVVDTREWSCDTPSKFDPTKLGASQYQIERYLGFCKEHGIELASQPTWLLSSCG